jgi:hypothetical protein
MLQQLRIYEIFDDTKAAFHDRFRDHAARIMRKYGFRIVSMWEARTDRRTGFVYMLEWSYIASKTRAWEVFMAMRNGRRSSRSPVQATAGSSAKSKTGF